MTLTFAIHSRTALASPPPPPPTGNTPVSLTYTLSNTSLNTEPEAGTPWLTVSNVFFRLIHRDITIPPWYNSNYCLLGGVLKCQSHNHIIYYYKHISIQTNNYRQFSKNCAKILTDI